MVRSAIIAVLVHLDEAGWLDTTLGAVGAEHAAWDVTEPMYAAVGECMVAAMSEIGGEAWTPETTAAWTEALGAVAGLLREAAPMSQTRRKWAGFEARGSLMSGPRQRAAR